MEFQSKSQDPVITRKVTETLAGLGVRAPCQVRVVSEKGNVTLSGTIQYEHQRRIAVRGTMTVPGVQRVVDQMKLIPGGQRWKNEK